jgi:hypothetical protein
LNKQRIARLSLVSPLLALLGLCACPAWSGTFKCREPDGSISYQQTSCPQGSDGVEVVADTTPPGGAEAPGAAKKYSVQSQLKTLEQQRRRTRKERAKDETPIRQTKTQTASYDAARCAKHRAEAARWRREVRNGYVDRDQKEQEAQMLKHHEALVLRYCEPEP